MHAEERCHTWGATLERQDARPSENSLLAGEQPHADLQAFIHVLSHFIHGQVFATLCTVARYAPLSMGFSKQESWSGMPCPPPGDLPDPGIEPTSLMSPALTGSFFTTSATWGGPSAFCWKAKTQHVFQKKKKKGSIKVRV